MAGEWKKALEKVPADKRAALEAELSALDGFITELDAGYMRQEDYSTKLNAASEARKVWEAEKKLMEDNYATAQAEYKTMLADWESSAEEKKAAKEELEKATRELAEHKAKAATINPETVLTTDKYKEEQNKFAAGQTAYFTEAMDAVYEIEQLTQQRIKPGDFLNRSLAAKKSPLEFAEETYKLSEKRAAKDAADKAAHEKQIRDDERNKVVAEYANPATRPLADSKDPFFVAKDQTAKQPWELTETPADELAVLNELSKARPN